MASEPISPGPASPLQDYLPVRAIPDIPIVIPPMEHEERGYVPLFRVQNDHFYDDVFSPQIPQDPYRPDPSTYRTITAHEPIQGLLPPRPDTNLLNIHPFCGLAESYDSNITQSYRDRVSDAYTTISGGFDAQLGTGDSDYIDHYDTILAANIHYLGYADLFTDNARFDALNHRLEILTRIGRTAAIWRPFLNFSDVTGSNVLTAETDGRTRRQRLSTGVEGIYHLASRITWGQTFERFYLVHPNDPAFIDNHGYRSFQTLSYNLTQTFNILAWTEYRATSVGGGSDGQEFSNGIGWDGKPDPRLSTQIYLGWDEQHLNNVVFGRRDVSGVRVTGHTTFEWSERLRLTLKYDRNYTFNEEEADNNYVNNTLQFYPQIFLGGNWYITPYFGVSYNKFEASDNHQLEIRPECEIAYGLPNNSRLFAKIGYEKTRTVHGPATPVEIYRLSIGMNWNF